MTGVSRQMQLRRTSRWENGKKKEKDPDHRGLCSHRKEFGFSSE